MKVKPKALRSTYVDNVLKLPENSSNRLTNDGNSGEKSSLSNEDVEEGLVDADKLFRC